MSENPQVRALAFAGWYYDWNADSLLGRGMGWCSTLAFAVTMTEAILMTARAQQ